MRTAQVCPTCATYQNSLCILYEGEYLSALDITPGDSLESIIIKINTFLIPFTTTTTSTTSAPTTTTTTTEELTTTTTTEAPTTTTTTTLG